MNTAIKETSNASKSQEPISIKEQLLDLGVTTISGISQILGVHPIRTTGYLKKMGMNGNYIDKSIGTKRLVELTEKGVVGLLEMHNLPLSEKGEPDIATIPEKVSEGGLLFREFKELPLIKDRKGSIREVWNYLIERHTSFFGNASKRGARGNYLLKNEHIKEVITMAIQYMERRDARLKTPSQE